MEKSHYVLERFMGIAASLESIIEAMPIKRSAIDIYRQKNSMQRAKDTYEDLESLKVKLLEIIKELRLLFSEAEMPSGAEFSNSLYGAVKGFNIMTPDYSKLNSALSQLFSYIPKTEKATSELIGHLMNNVKMGYYPTDLEHVKRIKEALTFPALSVNLFDPCCGEGFALEMLGADEVCITFGTEIDESRGKESEKRLDRVGFGSYFHSTIRNEVFHAIFLNPPYLSVIGKNGVKARSEKRFLVESIHHLMDKGVLIYIIPYYRLTFDICRVICDNFENVSVYRFPDKEFAKYKQIVVMGIKKKREDSGEQAEILSQYAMMPEKIPGIVTLAPKSYPLPDVEKKVDLFKGANFNLGELQRQLAKSKSINILFEKSRIDAMEKRPLLPLNIGQVGLIGGSGLINGYVDCEKPHVIKGRVIKEVVKREDILAGTVTETRVNRMLFNILTPNGVKRLA